MNSRRDGKVATGLAVIRATLLGLVMCAVASTHAQPADVRDVHHLWPMQADGTPVPWLMLSMPTTPTEQIYRLLKGDQKMLVFLENADVTVVPIIESALARMHEVRADEVPNLLEALASLNWPLREHATWRLLGIAESDLPMLQSAAESASVAEVRHRATSVLATRTTVHSGAQLAARRLRELYVRHTASLFPDRWRKLMADPHDVDALRFFAYAPFETVWPLLADRSDEQRLRYLMAMIHVGHTPQAMFEALRRYPAGAVIRAARESYWPVEIESVQKDGNLGWTTLARAADDNVVVGVLRLSVKMSDYPRITERGEWVNLVQWDRWTYLFRYSESFQNRNAVVYAERHSPAPLPYGYGDRPAASGRTTTVRDWPDTVTVPFVRITQQESWDWHHGRAFEWARDLFPPRIAADVHFRETTHPEPAIVAPPGE